MNTDRWEKKHTHGWDSTRNNNHSVNTLHTLPWHIATYSDAPGTHIVFERRKSKNPLWLNGRARVLRTGCPGFETRSGVNSLKEERKEDDKKRFPRNLIIGQDWGSESFSRRASSSNRHAVIPSSSYKIRMAQWGLETDCSTATATFVRAFPSQ